MDASAPAHGHPLANACCAGRADATGVWFEGGRIDALIAAGGRVLRTRQPDAVCFGLGQARRALVDDRFEVLHVVFAPSAPRPLLLGLVRLHNRTRDPLLVHYTELWEIAGVEPSAAEGAVRCSAPEGVRALAELSVAIRARPPQPLSEDGLALDVRLVLPPGARRELAFGYVAPPPGEDPAPLASAWRGGVVHELAASAKAWRSDPGADALAAYRQRFVV